MRTLTLFLSLLLLTINLNAQEARTQVLTLASFHFNFPNNDFVQTDQSDQIDVLKPVYQDEIKMITGKLEKFDPDIIVIECSSTQQKSIDSLYQAYLYGRYDLKRSEYEQIGFRVAKMLGLGKLYCVDEWGAFNEQVDRVIHGKRFRRTKRVLPVLRRKFRSRFKISPRGDL